MVLRWKAKHKYNAQSCEADGKKFPSKLEARYYAHLKTLQKIGEVIFFLRQIPFDLPGNSKYVCDFQVFYANGDIEFIDCKGMITDTSHNKIKAVQALYPVEIKIVTSKDF